MRPGGGVPACAAALLAAHSGGPQRAGAQAQAAWRVCGRRSPPPPLSPLPPRSHLIMLKHIRAHYERSAPQVRTGKWRRAGAAVLSMVHVAVCGGAAVLGALAAHVAARARAARASK